MIDIRQLRYFQAVAEELHFGRAAARIRIAQPALSRQIQSLEEELGVLLLKRSQRSVELTPAGTLFLDRASRILDDIVKAQTDARRVGMGEFGHLVVGFIHSSTYDLLPAILERFRHLYPDVELDLREMTIAQQFDALGRGLIDIGLLRPPSSDPRLEVQTILTQQFQLAVPANHPLAGLDSVPLARVAEEPFIMFSQRESPLFHARIMRMCETVGFTPRVVQNATQIHTVVGLVGAGMGVALVPEVARNLHMAGVRTLSLEDAHAPVHVALGWQKANETPAIRSLRQVALLVVQQLAAKRPEQAPSSDARPMAV
ncbi:LysR family transcriptional regulator (plasmid) [Azospirillum sp. TSA2s]|uniref:LysR family transcriptional regulator n=1 Tax=Azospirillum sp. TSA2s TaxID=709810 RepID=UPI0010AA3D9A|nr:LysR family transcriptional regulator [Azospirillum sp. TSA2s]QCG99337.1 LysR family transcriptional regulator [Azospirillum sp. TSA2s]